MPEELWINQTIQGTEEAYMWDGDAFNCPDTKNCPQISLTSCLTAPVFTHVGCDE